MLKIARILIQIQGLLDPDPDWDFWLDPDPVSSDSEYGSETLVYTVTGTCIPHFIAIRYLTVYVFSAYVRFLLLTKQPEVMKMSFSAGFPPPFLSIAVVLLFYSTILILLLACIMLLAGFFLFFSRPMQWSVFCRNHFITFFSAGNCCVCRVLWRR